MVCAAGTDIAEPRPVAYRSGVECAADRLLLDGRAGEAKDLLAWNPPRLAVTGGMLIKRGLREGPAVSKTLRQIEERWISAGFPSGDELDSIVSGALAEALR